MLVLAFAYIYIYRYIYIYIHVLACLLHFTALYLLLIACELYRFPIVLTYLPVLFLTVSSRPVIVLFLLVARVANLPGRVVLTVCSLYFLLYYSRVCRSYLLDYSSFLPIFIYLPVSSASRK